jgi:uncharacterized protein DUF6791/ThiF family protein
MSPLQLARSADLQRLRSEGYNIEALDGHLVVSDVPYVTDQGQVARGKLVCPLTLSGDVTARPGDHVMHFIGTTPHQRSGRPFKFINSSSPVVLTSTLTATHMFSSKPDQGYADYYEKVSAYAALLENEARAIDPSVTARTFPIVLGSADETVFEYIDTASSRAGISAISAKLAAANIAIVGLGGTGSYILDFVAKTPVSSIHLFDSDIFLQHNAFRAPGASSAIELSENLSKVEYHQRTYSRFRRNIVAHAYKVDGTNVAELTGMDFVFLSLDSNTARESLVRGLEKADVPFIDVGMGLMPVGGSLTGTLRVTTSTSELRDHVWSKNRIPFPSDDAAAIYDQNIQLAELNALNAALAVIKWKKLLGFYVDLEQEYFSTYSIDGNHMTNDDLL